MSTSTYTREARSQAAKDGWVMRRAYPKTPPTPERLAWDRFLYLRSRVEDGPARLYACDLAESILHHYTEAFPDDPRPAAALYVARRYARGEASDYERLWARRFVGATIDGHWAPGWYHGGDPAYAAINAVDCCLGRPSGVMVDQVRRWVEPLRPSETFTQDMVAALEAMPRKGRPAAPRAAHIERSA